MLHTDIGTNLELTLEQLTGNNAPWLCNVHLPKRIKGIDPYRDCDRIPQSLVRLYPEEFPDLQSAQEYVNRLRQKKFE